MPKKIKADEEYEEEDDYDDEEEDEEEAPPRKVGRPPLAVPNPKKYPKMPAAPVKRYVAFHQQAADGIVDSETQEVIASDLWDALADIKSQLDRIETTIGVMQG